MIKTIVITGATSGIGYEAAKVFAKEGHRVIFLARNFVIKITGMTLPPKVISQSIAKVNLQILLIQKPLFTQIHKQMN